jgi:tetratricopeptide (TPR) repeat protein
MVNFENPELLRCYWLAEYWYWNKEKWIDLVEKAFDLAEKRDAEVIYNLVELYLLEHRYDKAKELIRHFFRLDKEWKLEVFDRYVEFYREKMDLYKKFLDIVYKK